jgi:hypothetical protein
MKTFTLALAALILTAGAAQAAPLTCNSNVDNNPRKGNTSITINSVSRDRVEISQVTSGGMAHFITAPLVFDASVKNEGPEMVKYENAEKGFTLEVVYQPIAGKIRGTLTAEVMGSKYSSPVVCVKAMN